MSEPLRICLVGSTGLIGSTIVASCVGREDVRLTAISRRQFPLPRGAKMELFIAEPDKWGEVFEAMRPRALICAVGTTWAEAGEDEDAFRAVDKDLVLDTARAAKEQGIERLVVISAAGADPMSRDFYLRVKGETERELRKLWGGRLDLLRPGLLRGKRGSDRRAGERIGILGAPISNLFTQGQFRAIRAETVADAALALAMRGARGRFAHDNAAIERMARQLPRPDPEAA